MRISKTEKSRAQENRLPNPGFRIAFIFRPEPAVLMSLIPYTQSSRWHVFRAADWLIWHFRA